MLPLSPITEAREQSELIRREPPVMGDLCPSQYPHAKPAAACVGQSALHLARGCNERVERRQS